MTAIDFNLNPFDYGFSVEDVLLLLQIKWVIKMDIYKVLESEGIIKVDKYGNVSIINDKKFEDYFKSTINIWGDKSVWWNIKMCCSRV